MPVAEKIRSVRRLRQLAKAAQESKAPRHVRRFLHLELIAAALMAGQTVEALTYALEWDLKVLRESEGGMARRVLTDLEAMGYDATQLRDSLREGETDSDDQNDEGNSDTDDP